MEQAGAPRLACPTVAPHIFAFQSATGIPAPKTKHPKPRALTMDWPVATVLLGTLGTLAVGILKWVPRRGDDSQRSTVNGRIYARATDMAEIRARLESLEQAHHTLRAELRADLKELQGIVRHALAR